MLSKDSAQLLANLVSQHVRVTPDGSSRADELFVSFQTAMRELQAIIDSPETSKDIELST